MNFNFKTIRQSAVNSFELIARIQQLKTEFISQEIDTPASVLESKRAELKRLCIDLQTSVEFLNNKRSINLIRNKLNKKKREKKTSKCIFYHNELENLLRNKKLFWETNSTSLNCNQNANQISLFNSKIISNNRIPDNCQETTNLLIEFNNQLNDLKELREYLLVHSKLLTIRSQHNNLNIQQNLNTIKINELINQVDKRRIYYENEKRKLKEQIKASNLNSVKYEQLKQKELLNTHLNRIEHSIKEYLFGTDNINKSLEACNPFELFQRQAENSIEQLVLIRQEWDNFVSNSSKAESVPVEWVYKETLSSDEDWIKFAKINFE